MPPLEVNETPAKRIKLEVAEPPSKENQVKNDDRLAVTVLSGFLGAGKTSVLRNLLHSKEHGLRIAVIVNDMAAVNVDAKAVVKVAPKLVAMQNGCICCTLREDLIQQVADLAKEKADDGSKKWNYVVIESTGISEPLPVAQTFVMEVDEDDHDHDHDDHHEDEKKAEEETEKDADNKEKEEGGEVKILTENPLLKYARLDTMVTVVDACNFFRNLSEIQKIKDQPDAEGDEDEERTLADLMVDQVEFANVILLNKCDSMIAENKEKDLDAVEQLLKRLNPEAVVIRTNHGKISHDKILNTHLFDMDLAQQSAGWLAELAKPAHTPETEEYGVSSMVFRANKPFHPTRLSAIINGFESMFEGVIRSKGQLWLANALSFGFVWHTAGYTFGMEPTTQPFLVSAIENALEVPYLGKVSCPEKIERAIKDVFGDNEEAIDEIETFRKEGHWSSDWGDRNQELVLIGVDLDKSRMKEELEKALLTDEEMEAGMKDFEVWKTMEDPIFEGKCAEMYWDLPEEESDDEEEIEHDAVEKSSCSITAE